MTDFDDIDPDDGDGDGEELPDEGPELSEYDQAVLDALERLGLDSLDDFHPVSEANAEHPEDIRGDRFDTAADALIFLAEIGVIDFSEVIEFAEGTYGVEIGDSGSPT